MDEAFWALGRASGVVLLVLMTATLLLGLLTRSGRPLVALPRFAVTVLHRNLALLSVVFLAVHVGSLLLDPYAQLSAVDVLVPFLNTANPIWLGFGTVALDLTLAVVVTALLRHRIGPRVFKAVHWAAYALWPVSLAHALGEGSDAGSAWFVGGAVVAAALVAGAIAWRLTAGFVECRRVRLEPAR